MSHLLKRFPFLGVINNIQFVSNFFRRMGDERSYANIYEDYSDERYSEFFEQKDPLGLPELKVDFKEKLKSTVDNLLGRLETGMASSSKSDVTMYTGTSGYALLFWMLSRKRKDDTFRDRSIQILEVAFSKLRNRDVTFIIGDPGPLALGAVIYHMRGMTDRSSELVKRIKSMVPDITDLESDLPDEALYGRVGYLYALLFLNHYLQSNTVEDSIIRQVVSAILASGISLAKSERRKVPLMYSWHGSYYLGAAHGISGILYTLLLAREHLTDSELTELVRPTIDFLLSTSFPSGNLPSSLGREKDKLVHWCHGAPGAVYLYSLAYEVFNDERYLDAANKCGDVVWDRGLLRKGYGLCHGVAGNAYTFLCLHQLLNRKTADPKAQHKADSRDVKNLYRACKFAEWCTTYNQHQDRTPDRPFSLFEGLAGTIYFLNDLQDPMEARFPAYAL
ncbi:glutathione S-transferase LANCL1 [Hetaerina americana]|uniref:glutathione S-transferase LANCL1 n=1 Tax=Hetaerina americana TaxID=62018 RepID=UPI003A7F590A